MPTTLAHLADGDPHGREVGVGSILASRYELLAQLGRGGMGRVFKARDQSLRTGTDELVALKVLLPGTELSPEVLARFRDEVKLARRVRHRNVCAIYEYQQDGDLPFIVMELVEGTDLKRTLQKVHSLEWEDAFKVSLQVSEGLSAIHEVSIIHRDLKPANITRDGSDVVRVMDFGIAKGATQAGFTDIGKVVGTIDYMSPEQIRSAPLDSRSDIYSFGIVIYELFTGRVPFRGDLRAIAEKHLTEPPPLYGVAAEQIPPSLVPVLERALAKDRNHRFSSAGEMTKALRAARDQMIRDGTDPLSGSGERLDISSREVGPYPAHAQLLVPALVRALGSPDRATRIGAAEALARTPSESARDALSHALGDEDGHVREWATRALRALDKERREPPPDDQNLPPTSDIELEARPTPPPPPVEVRAIDPPIAPLPLPPARSRIPRWVLWLVGLVVVVALLLVLFADRREQRDDSPTGEKAGNQGRGLADGPRTVRAAPVEVIE